MNKNNITPLLLDYQSARIFNSVDEISVKMPLRISESTKSYSVTDTLANSSDCFVDDLDETIVKRLSTTALTLKVINSSFIFGSFMLPYYMEKSGIILGTILFIVFFIISYIQSDLLLEIKIQAKRETDSNSLAAIFTALNYSPRKVTVFRVIFILNHLLYLIFCFMVFSDSLQAIIELSGVSPDHHFLSKRLFVILAGILVLPLVIVDQNPVKIVAVARSAGWFAIVIINVAAVFLNPEGYSLDVFYPNEFTVSQEFSVLPSILLAFAFHQAYFTASIDLEATNVKKGSLLGTIIIMMLEVIVSSMGAIAFRSQFKQYENNMLNLIGQSSFIPTGLKISFFLIICVSSLVQILQYIPQSVTQIQNIRKQWNIPLQTNKKKFSAESPTKPFQFKFSLDTSITKNLKDSDINQNQQSIAEKRSPWISIISTLITTLISLSLPPLILPIIFMGAITQNALSMLLPSFLYLKWKQERGGLSNVKEILAYSTLTFSLIFGFACLLSGVIQIKNIIQ